MRSPFERIDADFIGHSAAMFSFETFRYLQRVFSAPFNIWMMAEKCRRISNFIGSWKSSGWPETYPAEKLLL
jgi:hypothetical protein